MGKRQLWQTPENRKTNNYEAQQCKSFSNDISRSVCVCVCLCAQHNFEAWMNYWKDENGTTSILQLLTLECFKHFPVLKASINILATDSQRMDDFQWSFTLLFIGTRNVEYFEHICHNFVSEVPPSRDCDVWHMKLSVFNWLLVVLFGCVHWNVSLWPFKSLDGSTSDLNDAVYIQVSNLLVVFIIIITLRYGLKIREESYLDKSFWIANNEPHNTISNRCSIFNVNNAMWKFFFNKKPK